MRAVRVATFVAAYLAACATLLSLAGLVIWAAIMWPFYTGVAVACAAATAFLGGIVWLALEVTNGGRRWR